MCSSLTLPNTRQRAVFRLHNIHNQLCEPESLLSPLPTASETPNALNEGSLESSGIFGTVSQLLKTTRNITRLGVPFTKMQFIFRRVLKRSPFTMADVFEDTVKQYAHKDALLYQTEKYTFTELNNAANRVAQWATEQGLGKGSTVALLMKNRPEFFITWIGLAKLGITVALINTNLTQKPLVHALTVSNADHLILGVELFDAFETVKAEILPQWKVWAYVGNEPTPNNFRASMIGLNELDVSLSFQSARDPPKDVRIGVKLSDPLFLIYTSGTTGMPKPCKVSHKKVFYYFLAFSMFGKMTDKDRVYVTLPLYHSNGGVLPLSVWRNGGAIALARKFSARRFWEEARIMGATSFIYIGEVCRYLFVQPPSPNDKNHGVRLMFGNGLRADIWDEFRDRFGIQSTLEFYGATEANAGLINLTNQRGCCGQLPGFTYYVLRFRIIRYDVENNVHLRDDQGLCMECKAGEVGEAVAEIDNSPEKLTGNFDGYTDKAATQAKVLHNVFGPGDSWFRTGDLMYRDSVNNYYFVDRIGDTFRWKGENVATSEVEQVIGTLPWISEIAVYGVAIPGKDGRAGMAAIVTKDEKPIRLDDLLSVMRGLPAYARPVFVRQVKGIATTSTFKHSKVPLVKEGVNPDLEDPVYFLDATQGKEQYKQLTRELYDGILSGKVQL